MKKFFGDAFVGVWFTEDGATIFPFRLCERENEFEWLASDPNQPDLLFPHKNGEPLKYDEEA